MRDCRDGQGLLDRQGSSAVVDNDRGGSVGLIRAKGRLRRGRAEEVNPQ